MRKFTKKQQEHVWHIFEHILDQVAPNFTGPITLPDGEVIHVQRTPNLQRQVLRAQRNDPAPTVLLAAPERKKAKK